MLQDRRNQQRYGSVENIVCTLLQQFEKKKRRFTGEAGDLTRLDLYDFPEACCQ